MAFFHPKKSDASGWSCYFGLSLGLDNWRMPQSFSRVREEEKGREEGAIVHV